MIAGPRTFIFVGPSGSGKGTQAALLVKALSQRGDPVLYLETGERFRQFFEGRSWTAQRARELSNQGNRLPSFLSGWNWAESLIQDFTGDQILVIDGSPRSLLEAEVLDTALPFYQAVPAAVIFLNVGAAEVIDRLQKRGRTDDQTAERIKKRLAWFETEVRPALEFYRRHPERYRLMEVNGEQSVEAVWAEVTRLLTWP